VPPKSVFPVLVQPAPFSFPSRDVLGQAEDERRPAERGGTSCRKLAILNGPGVELAPSLPFSLTRSNESLQRHDDGRYVSLRTTQTGLNGFPRTTTSSSSSSVLVLPPLFDCGNQQKGGRSFPSFLARLRVPPTGRGSSSRPVLAPVRKALSLSRSLSWLAVGDSSSSYREAVRRGSRPLWSFQSTERRTMTTTSEVFSKRNCEIQIFFVCFFVS